MNLLQIVVGLHVHRYPKEQRNPKGITVGMIKTSHHNHLLGVVGQSPANHISDIQNEVSAVGIHRIVLIKADVAVVGPQTDNLTDIKVDDLKVP